MSQKPLLIGLTGGIGMGKTTIAKQLETLGAKVWDSDIYVHSLLAQGGEAVAEIATYFPDVVNGGAVNRKALGEVVFADPAKLQLLESILHPKVVMQEEAFIHQEWKKGAKLIVLDIPLLFETGAQARCDVVMVVSAPRFLQRQRVLMRPGMTQEKFEQVIRTQLPDRIKRQFADKVIYTGLGKGYSYRQAAEYIGSLS